MHAREHACTHIHTNTHTHAHARAHAHAHARTHLPTSSCTQTYARARTWALLRCVRTPTAHVRTRRRRHSCARRGKTLTHQYQTGRQWKAHTPIQHNVISPRRRSAVAEQRRVSPRSMATQTSCDGTDARKPTRTRWAGRSRAQTASLARPPPATCVGGPSRSTAAACLLESPQAPAL